MDPIREELRKLVRLLQPQGIRLIIGGGYGLLLRTEHVHHTGARTRFPDVPGARSTNDLDIFLSTEIITNSAKTQQVRAALDELGYVPIAGAKYYQFVRHVDIAGLPRGLKIDLLATVGPGDKPKVKIKDRRIRPRNGTGHKLHAHTTPEALTIEESLLEYEIGDSQSERLTVYLPHPLSYILLKLFAVRDRAGDSSKGPYHAFDIYRVIAMMTEEEWDQCPAMRDKFSGEDILAVAGDIVRELFSSIEADGVRMILAHANAVGERVPEERLREFITDLRDLLLVE